MSEVSKEHRGLSPSSFSLFMSCARKFYLKKIVKAPIDPDSEADTESLLVGKAFHKCLENTRHKLDGFTLQQCRDIVVGEFELLEDQHLPLIFSMLKKYKIVHEKAGLKAIACEVEVSTDKFYGFVDVILQDSSGAWWIGDMKTAANYSRSLIPSLPRHPQLSLYAMHAAQIAKFLDLDPESYRGCRYRLTTKSKASKRLDEPIPKFIERLSSVVQSYDFILPKGVMAPDRVSVSHHMAKSFIDSHKEETSYMPNYGNCMAYFRPCEWWSQCHGKPFSEMMNIEVIGSD